MKQTITSAKMITIGLFTFCTMGLMNVTFASVKTDDPVKVKYIGKINNQLAIQLNLNNSEAGEYFINIKSMNYHILYSEIVKGVNLSKIFKLNMSNEAFNTPGFEVHVEVTSEKTHKTEVYTISPLSVIADDEGTTKL